MLLLDTSGLLSYHNENEPEHKQAVTLFELPQEKLVHSYVLAEFVALANARRLHRAKALAFIANLLEHPEVETTWVSQALHHRAMSLLEARLDKTYSLCDAVSFVLMREQGITDALSTDHHFEQEGFKRLLL